MKIIIEEPFEEKNANLLAIATFIISTLFFILYFFSDKSTNVLVVAWPFVLSALVLNAIMLTHLADYFIKRPHQRKYIANKILVLLINIPIVYLYYTIIMNGA